MCGIAGIIGELSPESATNALSAMLAAQVHRGPDDEGAVVQGVGEGLIALGNRRLAIQDLSTQGHQPMVNPDTGDVLVYNGEIYNSPDLHDTLAGMGCRFRGHSDTEVLLRAYERWGIECLDRLRGMFAFALWDARAQRLVLARDHLGIKPLYYASLQGRRFVFASEVKALLSSRLVPFAVDEQALAGYLAYGAVQEPLTIAQGVRCLPAGSWARVGRLGRIEDQATYWRIPQPETRNADKRLGQILEEGRALLETSVRRHLLSDVPVGVFLSSGLDSTAVAGLAQKVAVGEVHSFNVSFPDHPHLDEGPIADETAQRLGVTHHRCELNDATAEKWAVDGLESMDQPTMDGLNTYLVSRAVREQGLIVALSGQGGDEVFGGYPSFQGVPRWQRRLSWLRPLRPGWRAAMARVATVRMPRVVQEKARDMARTGSDVPGLYFHYRRLMSDEDLARIGLTASGADLSPSFQLPTLDLRHHVVPGEAVSTVGRLETAYYLRNMLLRDGDVFGMASSLEIRVPFLDRDLVDWAFRLPQSVLLPPGADGKHLLRRMCREFYGPQQLEQPKRGFALPFSTWIRGPLEQVTNECLDTVTSSGLVLPEGVARLKKSFLQQPHSAAWSRVWALVALGYWLRKNRAPAIPSTAL